MPTYHAICGDHIVTPDGVGPAAIIIRDQKIDAVLPRGELPAHITHVDAGTHLVMPGLVDSHVHINEPGRTVWEGFETATKAAAAGGITTLADMPLNSTPVTTSPDALRCKVEASAGKRWVHCGFHGGIVPANAAALDALVQEKILGVKAFMVDSGISDFPPVSKEDLYRAMPQLADAGIPLLVHAERMNPLGTCQPGQKVGRSYQRYLASRPDQWELDAIALLIELCRTTRCHVHIVHLSTARALPMIRAAKEDGLPLTVETCPHYLFFDAESIADGDTRHKCAPPIRERKNNGALWQALTDGTIDFVVSDHSPCPPALKYLEEGHFDAAWGGIASLQLGLPIMATLADQHDIDPVRLASWMAAGPAGLLGMADRKGLIAPGYDADILIWDPKAKFLVEAEKLYHRHKITPYAGLPLQGSVKTTYVDGGIVFDGARIQGSPRGRLVTRSQRPGS